MKTTKVSGIYKITNTINGKIYVGSAVCLSNRKSVHFKSLRENRHHSIILQRSFNKHGELNFKFEIIEEVEKENLIIREQFYIDTLKPEFNICKISGNTLGTKRSKKHCKKQSIRMKGMKAVNSLETYKISLDGKIIELFETVKLASEKTGLNKNDISSVCRGEQCSAGGFIWCYKKNIKNENTIKILVEKFNKGFKYISLNNINSKFLNKNVN